MRLCLAALCVVAMGCRDRGPDPRIDAVEPGDCYNDEALTLVLRGSFEPPVLAELADPSRPRLLSYAVQLVSAEREIDLPAAVFRGVDRLEVALEPGMAPGLYAVRVMDPWARSVWLNDALTVRFRYAAPVPGAVVDIDPPVTGPIRSPPRARLALWPQGNKGISYDLGVGIQASPLEADASLSDDSQTPAANLSVNWNFSGNTAVAVPGWPSATTPWNPQWTTNKAVQGIVPYGTQTVVLAARDDDGDVGYAARAVSVVTDTELCFVTTPEPGDDFTATSCTDSNGFGRDGVLSLDEALRLTSSPAGNEAILLLADPSKPPVTFTGPPIVLDAVVQIIGMPGVIIGREIIAGNVPNTLIGVEVMGPGGKLTVPTSKKMILLDSKVRETAIVASGHLIVERTRFERCAGKCLTVDGSAAELAVSQSTFEGAGSEDAIDAPQCDWNGSGYSLEIIGNTFTGFSTAIRVGANCGRPSRIVHDTFHANGVAVEYRGGSGHTLRNNIFTSQQGDAVVGCTAPTVSFASGERRDHLLFGNQSNGCIGADPGILTVHPLYVSSVNKDFRLRYGSPAINAAPALDIDVNGAAPSNYQGTAPDFGGRETY